jgi:hypothetical protein
MRLERTGAFSLDRQPKGVEVNHSGQSLRFVSMDHVERDKWYLLIDCPICDRGTVLREAPNPNDAEEPTIGRFSWKCPYCGTRQIAYSEQIQRCQGIYI